MELNQDQKKNGKNSADGIKIIHEKIEEDSFKKARELIKNAELLVFLGLNLHNTINIDRLDIKNKLEGKSIFGTDIGLSLTQKQDVNEYFENKLNKDVVKPRGIYSTPVYTAYKLLKEHIRLK